MHYIRTSGSQTNESAPLITFAARRRLSSIPWDSAETDPASHLGFCISASMGVRALGSLEKPFHVRDRRRHPIWRQALEERLPVPLFPDPRIEQHQHAAIFQRADQPAEALFQRENG